MCTSEVCLNMRWIRENKIYNCPLLVVWCPLLVEISKTILNDNANRGRAEYCFISVLQACHDET